MDTIFIIFYFISSILFILGIKMLSSPTTARKGNLISFKVENSDFYYELITDKLSSKKGVPSDLTIRPWVGKIEN